ncbi:MAG: GNAT family N-acetyltransferase [Oscillospiraceae bacterium]
MNNFEYRLATPEDLELIWAKNIADNPGDDRWSAWKLETIDDNNSGRVAIFVAVCDGVPVGEGTLIFSPDCSAIGGRTILANGGDIANVNALRMAKEHEGKGHMSRLLKVMEAYAKEKGVRVLTIGVEARESRNVAIYLHLGYDRFRHFEVEGDAVPPTPGSEELVLYYDKEL